MRKGHFGAGVSVRPTRPEDIDAIIEVSRRVYPGSAWLREQLESHLRVFPEGQLVAVDSATGRVLGMAASLIIDWDDYHVSGSWGEFTANGYFTNHDPEHGRTLYGAEVMVDPDCQGRGVGKKLYAARRDLCRRLGLLRIRAGARLRGYHNYANVLTPEDYVIKVVNREIGDPTLTFQLKQRFRVIAVVRDYLRRDPDSFGHAAVIEWINHAVAKPQDYAHRDSLYRRRRRQRGARSAPETARPPERWRTVEDRDRRDESASSGDGQSAAG